MRRAWNKVWFKYETGTKYLWFFGFSPTYTARNPFGGEVSFLIPDTERPRIFFAPKKSLTKASFFVCEYWSLKLLIKDWSEKRIQLFLLLVVDNMEMVVMFWICIYRSMKCFMGHTKTVFHMVLLLRLLWHVLLFLHMTKWTLWLKLSSHYQIFL